MIHKSFAFILFVLIGAGVGYSQTPEPKQERELAPRLFSFSLDGAGGYLGVQAEDVSKDNFNKFGLREVKGVGVESVVDGSPAQVAGLQKSDVILKVNGEDVTSTRKLTRLVSEIAPDHQARLTVLRNGAEREVIVTVGKRPGMSSLASGPPQWSESIDGIELPNMPNLKNLPRIERRLA
ncbi:MAG: PDZ domain-containing protein, partial [Acidobacteria bacterium]|nr:PDZ domain-containing protein [Acidobacteriota bacterium]